EAVSPAGEPYAGLENAFLFRSQYIEGCGCPRQEMQTAGTGMEQIARTLFPQGYKTAEDEVPMPARRPDRFDIGLFENPFSKAGPAAAVAASGGERPLRQGVRIVGPKYVYARSAEEADAVRDRKSGP